MDNLNDKLSNEEQSQPSCLGDVMCRLFHYIRTVEDIKFIDTVSGRSVGQFECVKCKRKFMANKKNSWFRCYNGT